jgi:hypothetical protein
LTEGIHCLEPYKSGGGKERVMVMVMEFILQRSQLPAYRPARKAAPNAVISEDFGLSTFKPVRSANNWSTKSFRETPPSTLPQRERKQNQMLDQNMKHDCRELEIP